MSTLHTQATTDLLSRLRRGEAVTPEAWLQSFISSREELEALDAQVNAVHAQMLEKTKEQDAMSTRPFTETHKKLVQLEAEAAAEEAAAARRYINAVTTLFKALAPAGHQESAAILCAEVAQAQKDMLAIRARRARVPKAPVELVASRTDELNAAVRALEMQAIELELKLSTLRAQSMLAEAALKRLSSSSVEKDAVATVQPSLPAPQTAPNTVGVQAGVDSALPSF